MKNLEIFEKLDILNESRPWNILLGYNNNDDYIIKNVFEWFIDGGYLHVENINRAYSFKLVKGNLEFGIGSMRKNRNQTMFFDETKISWKERSLAYFYKKNKNIKVFNKREEIVSKIVLKRVTQYIEKCIEGLVFDKIFINQLNYDENTVSGFFNIKK